VGAHRARHRDRRRGADQAQRRGVLSAAREAPPAGSTRGSLLASPARPLRDALREADRGLSERYILGERVAPLLAARAGWMDDVVLKAWRLTIGAAAPAGTALIAVGGYGRGELFPSSDVDLLILRPLAADAALEARIGEFIALLWDAGAAPSHSVRDHAACLAAAREDLSFATALLEGRPLAGDATAAQRLLEAASGDGCWTARDFLIAKRDELRARHERLHDGAYRLEPNVKEVPGGLRDLQTVLWVARRSLGLKRFDELSEAGLLDAEELAVLEEGRALLERIRFGLHALSGRREERLSFDAQLRLARQFGHEDGPNERAVEAFMQRYYRAVAELGVLSELLLGLLEAPLREPAGGVRELSPDFVARDGLLELAQPDAFARNPRAMLELFHLIQQDPTLRGVGPGTLRALRRHRHLIDAAFRADPENRALFMRILRGAQGVTHEFRRMARYGVLGRYIPAFGRVAGRMQFDLFHAFTVDEHSIGVLSNLRRFALARYDHEFPQCSRVMQGLAKPELVYLAGLFHDLGKGRGGDHSELGATDAEAFCLEHGLDAYDAHLVAWLVRNHLLLSLTAQKRDLNDPDTILAFARSVGDLLHLDCLYLLTVADVRATNPALWNSWKARLFADLHELTRAALRRGLEAPLDAEALAAATRSAAAELLAAEGLAADRIAAAWARLGPEHFARHSPEEVLWHTLLLAEAAAVPSAAAIAVRPAPSRGGTAVLVLAPGDGGGFVRAAAALDALGLTVFDARITALADGARLETYVVLEDDGSPLEDAGRLDQVHNRVARELAAADRGRARSARLPPRHPPRQVRLFQTPTRVVFGDAREGRTVLELVAGDRPGLLSEVGQVFEEFGLRVHAARITTVGERAEDTFYLTGAPLADAGERRRLAEAIERRLAQTAVGGPGAG
jgi:[protein-PII] uridylyltransferase